MDKILRLFGGSEQLWQYIQKYAKTAGIEGTRTVLELYYVLKSPDTPGLDKTIIVAALAYQLLPEDLISTENFGILGFIDNGAALALAYNRVKSRVTPQIDAQVNAILNQWFGGIQPAIASDADSNNNWNNPTSYNEGWREQPVQTPTHFNTPESLNKPRKPTTPMWDDDDVVID
ncbi:MAG: DUF1232 domain-containing protein [Bacteroidales bacterium]|nr:DUF1232 domain-containing protein [Bacteroidales bacterium]